MQCLGQQFGADEGNTAGVLCNPNAATVMKPQGLRRERFLVWKSPVPKFGAVNGMRYVLRVVLCVLF